MRAAELGPPARLWPSLAAVYRAQLSRARVARIPLLFVATLSEYHDAETGRPLLRARQLIILR